MNIESEFSRQVDISNWIDKNLSCGYEFNDEKERYALACFDIGIEHHSAILLLIQSKLYGSSLALIRVQYESFIRGLWIKYSSTESEFLKYKKDKLELYFGEMVKRVENSRGIKSGILSSIKKQQWKIFNSFTHTGIEALVRRIGSSTTGYDNYSEDDVIKLLRYTGFFVLLISAELALLAKNDAALEEAVSRMRAYGEKI